MLLQNYTLCVMYVGSGALLLEISSKPLETKKAAYFFGNMHGRQPQSNECFESLWHVFAQLK